MDDDMYHSQAAPAYALESDEHDSDSDDEAAEYGDRAPQTTAPKARASKPDPVVKFRGATVLQPTRVVFLVGEVAEVFARGAKTGDASATVFVDGEQAASTHVISPSVTVVFTSIALPLVSLYPFVHALLSKLSPTSTTIVAPYHSPSYIAEQPSASPLIRYLSSSPTPNSLLTLERAGHLSSFSPPNLLHGLAPLLLTLSTLSEIEASLILLPSIASPTSLNGPFLGPSSWSNTIYDAGGPTSLSDSRGVYGDVQASLKAVGKGLGWDEWYDAKKRDGKGSDWIERSRREKRREQAGSMYM
ncbi:BQ5605_C003g02350 [Microbotryum silenes-dioicae]|uniref:BQ5605_C003g02350 protein n=1 Tax=Microbotryum silenes-dioicae TaxID=796604 RepID=A0A2X0P410_9BASI|nr:BQ5605_C003g02350 [Microbotryum silenes-dioicae]